MRVAFLILSHREPSQLFRLLKALRLQLPDAPIVVHHDKFREPLSESDLKPFEDVHLILPDQLTAWGEFSVFAATWRSMTWLTENFEFDWLVLLSAQDYPIKPLAGFGDYLKGSGADAFIRAAPITAGDAARRRDMRRRYLYQYEPATPNLEKEKLLGHLRYIIRRSSGRCIDIINILQPYFKLYRLPDPMPYRFGWRASSTPFSEHMPCWHGSPWFSISRRVADFAVSYLNTYPNYAEYYRRTIMPDESAMATLVCNNQELLVDHREFHYIRWSNANSGHPDIFTAKDLPELMEVPQYFARKFDISIDSLILDRLDEIRNIELFHLGRVRCSRSNPPG